MAKQILNEPDQIPAVMSRSSTLIGRGRVAAGTEEEQKVMIPRRCTVDEVSFAAHVDGVENRNFIEEVAAPVVVSTQSKAVVLDSDLYRSLSMVKSIR